MCNLSVLKLTSSRLPCSKPCFETPCDRQVIKRVWKLQWLLIRDTHILWLILLCTCPYFKQCNYGREGLCESSGVYRPESVAQWYHQSTIWSKVNSITSLHFLIPPISFPIPLPSLLPSFLPSPLFLLLLLEIVSLFPILPIFHSLPSPHFPHITPSTFITPLLFITPDFHHCSLLLPTLSKPSSLPSLSTFNLWTIFPPFPLPLPPKSPLSQPLLCHPFPSQSTFI